ncbi:hypothetical protein SESBI_24337 [Sesbania bispinosa]|nr:hypothetical protein SESBI_24337 [Sesbania bispinosa]
MAKQAHHQSGGPDPDLSKMSLRYRPQMRSWENHLRFPFGLTTWTRPKGTCPRSSFDAHSR